MTHGFEVGDRVEVISDEHGHQPGVRGTIAFIKTKFIYVELDEPPPEHLCIMLLDPATNLPRLLSSFKPEQLRHIVAPTA